jgi:ubiquinone/menaquinone biosynthesis C-methylase UbiE
VFREGARRAVAVCLEHSRPGERWLDAGCGGGHLAERLLAGYLDVVAVDVEMPMLHAARARSAARGGATCAATVEALPFREAAFDGVLAVSLLGCLASIEPMLGECRRLLRPGGLLVATATLSDSWLRRWCRGTEEFGKWMEIEPAPGVGAQVPRMYTERELLGAVHAAGFEIQSARRYNFFVTRGASMIPPWRVASALESLARVPVLRSIGRNLLLTARRPAD